MSRDDSTDSTDSTDSELLALLTISDPRALSTFFDRYAAAVTRYAWAIAATKTDVEEIVQDTFVTLWLKSGTITLPDTSLLPWLLVTCRNHSLNLRRKRAKYRTEELPETISTHPQANDEAREELRWVLDEIERLDPIDKRICELCLIEGHPYAEAAEQVGISVGAVKKRVSRTRARLRKAVTDNED